ncbi:MAG TPA: hypothetical protein VF646_17390, partial [Cytophagales bacterium]
MLASAPGGFDRSWPYRFAGAKIYISSAHSKRTHKKAGKFYDHPALIFALLLFDFEEAVGQILVHFDACNLHF